MKNSEKKEKGFVSIPLSDQENVTGRSRKLMERKLRVFLCIKAEKILPRISRSDFIKIKTLHIETEDKDTGKMPDHL